MKTIQTKYKQTLFDIALQEYGSVEGVFLLVEDNNLYGILDGTAVGQELKIRDTALHVAMKTYLSPYTIATAEGAEAEGIGFWRTQEYVVH